jgi:hypothetical protein
MVLPAVAGPLTVEANKTVPVKLKGTAASVVLGNRNIADVAVHDEHHDLHHGQGPSARPISWCSTAPGTSS